MFYALIGDNMHLCSHNKMGLWSCVFFIDGTGLDLSHETSYLAIGCVVVQELQFWWPHPLHQHKAKTLSSV